MIIIITALFLLWWGGAWIPGWVIWQDRDYGYEEAFARLHDRTFTLSCEADNGTEQILFRTNWDWAVQDALIYDIDKDGRDEIILLVWKHGSYGDARPFWVEHNDIRLEQHIFIYRWEEGRDNRLRAVWMSSALDFDVMSMVRGSANTLVTTEPSGLSKAWSWQGFGLKYYADVEEQRASILCAGDNLIHTRLLGNGENGYDSFYEPIADTVRAADYATVNLETVLVEDNGLVSDYPRFGTPIGVGDALANAGFDLVTMANNHVLDQGYYGVRVTTDWCDSHNIDYVGVNPMQISENGAAESSVDDGSIRIIRINGIKVAMLNYTYATNGIPIPEEYPHLVELLSDRERMTQQINYAKDHADAVIVYVHWGEEYSNTVDETQEELADYFCEQGVDVVIGTHPHVLQPYEVLTADNGHTTLVYYSLGNLISGQTQKECMLGGMAGFTIVKDVSGEISIVYETLTTIVSHQADGIFTTYLLTDYTSSLAQEHDIEGMEEYLFLEKTH